MHWTEIGDSRLKLKHTIKIPAQLVQLYYKYHIAGSFKTKHGYSLFDKENTSSLARTMMKQVASLF
jgi:hypothetical protein